MNSNHLAMANCECSRLEGFLDENGLTDIDVTYVLLQKQGQRHPGPRQVFPDFVLVSNEGPTITPTQCFIIQSFIAAEHLQQIAVKLSFESVPGALIPCCNMAAEKLLHRLKND